MYSEKAQLWYGGRNDGSSHVSKEEGEYEWSCWQQGENVDRPNQLSVQEGRLLLTPVSHPCVSLLRASLWRIKVNTQKRCRMTISHGAWSYSIIKPSSASQARISLSGLEQGWWGLAVPAKEKKKKWCSEQVPRMVSSARLEMKPVCQKVTRWEGKQGKNKEPIPIRRGNSGQPLFLLLLIMHGDH